LPSSATLPLDGDGQKKILERVKIIEQHERKILYYQEWNKK
jgi:hypothetical protein